MGNKCSQERWIEKANNIHNKKYDYSKAFYEGSKKQIEIICPIHGSFFLRSDAHLSGYSCAKCKKANKIKSKEEVIVDFIKVHGNRYDYSKVEYVDNKTKIEIICPIHGSFFQAPINHLKRWLQ